MISQDNEAPNLICKKVTWTGAPLRQMIPKVHCSDHSLVLREIIIACASSSPKTEPT
jgi:hypothetical protein